MISSKFTRNPGSRVIIINGTQPKQAQVSIRESDVSNNPGPYSGQNCSFGGAIVCRNSTTLIEHCTIKGNKALVITPTFLGGGNAGSDIGSSDVTLNDTLIEGNEALYVPAIFIAQNSTVMINRCTIAKNHALRVLYNSVYIGGADAGIAIGPGSEVTMDDVIIADNRADDNSSAISNSGIFNLKEGAVITRNTAKNYSAIGNSELGIVNIQEGGCIFNNHDEHQPCRPIHSEGILNDAR